MKAGTSVLIVDEDPAARDMLQTLLLQQEYAVRQADNIAATLALFTKEPSSLVFVAPTLPDGSRADLINALRTRAPDVIIIALGPRSWEATRAAWHNHASDYLPNDATLPELLDVLSNIAHMRNTHTDQSEQEQALRAQLAHMQTTQATLAQVAAFAAISRLSANLAHEINNPLTPILGMVRLLQEDLPKDHIGHTYAQVIDTSARRIRDLLRNLRDFARSDFQEYTLIDATNVLSSALLLTEQRLYDQGILLRTTTSPQPLTVLGNAGQLKQALMNLLDNAREAMPNGGRLDIDLRINADAAAPGHYPTTTPTWAIIALSDTGTGIAEQHLPYIFEPFYSTKRQVVGVGLGLTEANSIVQEHGGMIEVDTQEGHGSTFRVILPLAATTE